MRIASDITSASNGPPLTVDASSANRVAQRFPPRRGNRAQRRAQLRAEGLLHRKGYAIPGDTIFYSEID